MTAEAHREPGSVPGEALLPARLIDLEGTLIQW